jgi:hypothetical protein
MHARKLTAASLLAAATTVSATAQEVTVQNDSFDGFGIPVGDFIANEHAGVRLTSPCDGAIVGIQIAWQGTEPGGLPSLEQAINIYEGDTFPAPGSEMETLVGPVMTPGFINEFRFLDDTKNFPLLVPVTNGQQFFVTLQYANPTDVGNGGPSVVRDLDGCQSGKNVLFAVPGGWIDFCFIIQGDLVMRAIVDCSVITTCAWDCGDQDQFVGIIDFLTLLAQWTAVDTSCDIDGGGVGITDLLDMLANWGPCP